MAPEFFKQKVYSKVQCSIDQSSKLTFGVAPS